MIPKRKKTFIISIAVGLIILVTFGCQKSLSTPPQQPSYTLFSPDKKINVTINVAEQLSYSVWVDGKETILDSPLGLELKNAAPIGKSLAVYNKKLKTIDENWKPVWSTSSPIKNHCNELRLAMKETNATGRKLDLIVRTFNDGVAFRYYLPKQKDLETFTLTWEKTYFRPAAQPDCWAADFKSFYSHQEAKYPQRPWSEITNATIWGVPLLMKIDDSLYIAITEANLDNWAGMYLAVNRDNYGRQIYNSGSIKGGDSPKEIDVSVRNVKTLRLIVEPVDPIWDDRADWADAKLIDADGSVTYLSDIEPVAKLKGLQKDKNPDGKEIKLGDKIYEKGIGTFSRNEIVYDLDKKYDRLHAIVGIDAASEDRGLVRFEVYASPEGFSRRGGLVSILSPLPDSNGDELVRASTPLYSPWRVIMIGREPGDLIESEIIVNLNPPCQIKDTSWVKPGIMVWDHWWSGEIKMDTKTIKEYVQFAADMNFPYMLIDWGWYGPQDRDDADVTKVTKTVDMPELLRFAKERNVKLWVWVYWTDLDRKLEEAFALYEKWGLAGVKVDFMQRDDQQMVNWYHKVIANAAKHHLMLDFHGAYKPTGIRRTWPNFTTREGVLGNEWNKWYDFMTAEHNVTIPFTRMLAGPMDYTPAGFLNRTKEQWKPGSPTKVQTTRCQQLAMLVVYESPVTCICDHPRNYYNQPGLEFMKVVPSNWDKTKVLNGEVGKYVTIARRAGQNWYLGAMTDQPITLKVPLDFLGPGKFTVHIFADAPDADKNPEHLVKETRPVKASDTLTIKMAASGGFAAYFIAEK